MTEFLSLDQAFIKKLTSIVLANLDNENFSAEELAKEAGMSRISLYRKLLSINHQNITQFIRKVRLQRPERGEKLGGVPKPLVLVHRHRTAKHGRNNFV